MISRVSIVLFAGQLCLPLAVAQTQDELLKKQAVKWIETNLIDKKADQPLIKAVSKKIDEFIQEGNNFTLIAGSGVVKTEQPTLVSGWCGELFTFDVSPKQAKSLGLEPLSLSANSNRRYGPRNPDPPVVLSDFQVENAESLDGAKHLKAKVTMKVLKDLPAHGQMRFRLDMKFPEFIRLRYFTPKEWPKKGSTLTLDLPFSPINEKDAKPYLGSVAFYLNLIENAGERTGEVSTAEQHARASRDRGINKKRSGKTGLPDRCRFVVVRVTCRRRAGSRVP